MQFRTKTALLCASAMFAGLLMGGPAKANPIADFYSGKQLSMYVGSSAGGGYDSYARIVTRHIGRFVPGEPTFVVQNMPGGGGMRVTNFLFNLAPKDGSALGTVQRGLLTTPLLEARNIQVQFDPMKFNWLGSLNSETGLIVVRADAPHKTMEDLFKNELIVASSSPSTDFLPLFLNNVLDTRFRIIPGYKSSIEAYQAVERGEVQGRVSTGWSGDKQLLEPWLKQGKVRLLAQLAMSSHPEFKHVPLILEFAKTEQQKQVMELILAAQHWGRPFVMPPGVPGDRVETFRKAMIEMTRDAAFLAEAKKLGMELDLVTGVEIDDLLRRVYGTPAPIVEVARKAISAGAR